MSVRDELLSQLNGEKLRVTELTEKINEMYKLEEEQRLKARDLADYNNRFAPSRRPIILLMLKVFVVFASFLLSLVWRLSVRSYWR
jgi:hypothetical protein